MMRRISLVMMAAVTLAAAARAQDTPTDARLFLERSYFAPFNPLGKKLVFEGDAAGHYFLFNQFDWAWTRNGGWAFAMPITMVFTVRMTDTVSQPVRTPSYRIRPIWLQAIHLTPETRDTKAFAMWGFGAGAMHYSNGQAGCTYQGFARDTTLQHNCIVTDAALAARRRPNLIDGDFSTTFFPVALYWRWGRMTDTSYHVQHQHTIMLEGQINPLGMAPGGLERELAMEYGRHQLNATYEYEHIAGCAAFWPRLLCAPGMRRLSLEGVYRTAQDSGRTWRTFQAEYARIYEGARGFGWFVRAHFGGDYYNIQFKENGNPLFTFGFVWDPGRIDMYNRAGRPVTNPD